MVFHYEKSKLQVASKNWTQDNVSSLNLNCILLGMSYNCYILGQTTCVGKTCLYMLIIHMKRPLKSSLQWHRSYIFCSGKACILHKKVFLLFIFAERWHQYTIITNAKAMLLISLNNFLYKCRNQNH